MEGIGGLSGSGSVQLQANKLTLGGVASTTFGGGVSGSGILERSGTGSITLTGANAFSGGTNIVSGAVYVGNASALGTGVVTLSGGVLAGDGVTARSLGNGFALTGDMTLGDSANSGKLTFGGYGTLSGTVNLTVLSDVEFSRTLAGTGSLTKRGVGVLTLKEAGTPLPVPTPFSGGLTIEEGAVVAGDEDNPRRIPVLLLLVSVGDET